MIGEEDGKIIILTIATIGYEFLLCVKHENNTYYLQYLQKFWHMKKQTQGDYGTYPGPLS